MLFRSAGKWFSNYDIDLWEGLCKSAAEIDPVLAKVESSLAKLIELDETLTLTQLEQRVEQELGSALGIANDQLPGLLAFRFEDEFGLSPTVRGLLLTVFGVAGILSARRIGILIDRIGARSSVMIGALGGAVLVSVVGLAGLVPVIAIAWFVAGVASQFVLVGVNAAVLGSAGPNRGGAVSVVQAMRFGGAALAPLALTPIYDSSPAASFLIPALLLAVVAPLIMPKQR